MCACRRPTPPLAADRGRGRREGPWAGSGLVSPAPRSLGVVRADRRALRLAGMLFYNSTLSLPMLALAAVVAGEPARVLVYPQLLNRQYQARGARAAAALPAARIGLAPSQRLHAPAADLSQSSACACRR